MKTKVLSLVALFVLGTFTLFAANKTEKFEVSGKCGMCESRIEKAAKSVEGVSAADWDKKTQMLEVSFDDWKKRSIPTQGKRPYPFTFLWVSHENTNLISF